MPLTKFLVEKLAALEKIANDFPGAIIVHELRNTSVVYMNPWGLSYLGTTLADLQALGPTYHDIYFNPEDGKDYGPKLYGLLERNNNEEFVTYFQQVRKSVKDDFIWFLASTKVFFRGEDGKPSHIISTCIPVDANHNLAAKVQRMLDENNLLRRQQHIFNSLANREKEILRLMALGNSSHEIAHTLNIAEATAKTHRRNIKAKLEAENNYDIVKFAQAFNMI